MNVPTESLAGALWWGWVAASGIVLGAVLGVFGRLQHTSIASTMAFGAGLLLAASSVELAAEALDAGPWTAVVTLLAGATCFSLANDVLATRGAKHRKRCGECVGQPTELEQPGSGTAIALGSAIDALPEALVLGLTLRTTGPDAALLAAIALSNLPEAISGAAGMRGAGRRLPWVFGVWGTIAVATTLLTAAGFSLAGVLSNGWAAPLQAFGAGALIAMVAETMIPEAVEGTPRFSGLVAAAGFAALLLLGALTRS